MINRLRIWLNRIWCWWISRKELKTTYTTGRKTKALRQKDLKLIRDKMIEPHYLIVDEETAEKIRAECSDVEWLDYRKFLIIYPISLNGVVFKTIRNPFKPQYKINEFRRMPRED